MSSLVTQQQIADVCRLNNEGAEHYSKGRWMQALGSFRQSLLCIIARVTDIDRAHENGLLTLTRDHAALFELRQRFGFIDAATDARMSTSGDDSLVFTKAISFTEIPRYTHETALAVCGVIVFNMALACHGDGTGRNVSASLSKAIQLYDSGIDFFYKIPYGETIFAGVIAVALNNKIRIYYDEYRFDDLERDAGRLSKAVSIASQNISPESMLQEDDYEGILLNLLLLTRPYLAQAA